ncbi:MAG: glycosyltransferase family 2 protein [Thermoleophilaceae bacterium]
MAQVDVVVVSYNSRDELARCVEPLAGVEAVSVVVVDNASSDGSLEAVAGLPGVATIALEHNLGFAAGCNAGWRAGTGEAVLFLNPDARIEAGSVARLVRVLDEQAGVGIAAPRILHEDRTLDYSQRSFPRLRSTYGQALFAHRLFPRASWTDEVIRDERSYEEANAPDWVSGACLLVRRRTLEAVGGLDEGFFMYCEDKDLCRRVRNAGWDVRYVPDVVAVHAGGASAPRASLLPVLAASRIRYARKHQGTTTALLERFGVGLGAATRLLVSRGGAAARAGHGRAVLVTASRAPSRAARQSLNDHLAERTSPAFDDSR